MMKRTEEQKKYHREYMREWYRKNPEVKKRRARLERAAMTPEQRDKERERLRQWKRDHPDRVREITRKANAKKVVAPEKLHQYRLTSLLRAKYGIELRDFRAMEERQGGACAICKRKEKSGGRLSVDHCHASGMVRGLLCRRCNSAIGLMEEDTDRMQAAIAYLAAHWHLKAV